MKPSCYALLALLTLAPSLAAAQETRDLLLVYEGNEFVALGAAWEDTVPFIAGEEIGPLPLVIVESGPTGEFPDAPPDEGCNPYTPESAAEVAGNIAFVQRGVCSFVRKTQNASAAGAVAVIIYQDERVSDDSEDLVSMGGDPCGPAEGCTIPAAFISRASALAILSEGAFNPVATIISIGDFFPPDNRALCNGVVCTTLFADGFIGHDPAFAFGEGFVFEGENGLFVSSVLIGVDGEVTSNPYDGVSEFTPVENTLRSLAPSEIPDPFDMGATAQFTSPLGFTVTLSAYLDEDAPNTDFAIFDLAVENTSGFDIEDVYLGLFADFDAGSTTSTDDAGSVNMDLDLAYVYDPAEGGAYFGVKPACYGPPLSGASVDATTADDAQLFEALTTFVTPGAAPAERAAVVGVGPFDISPGETAYAQFSLVAGSDLADLLANATCRVQPATEETTAAGTYVLGSAYPNPFTSRTTLSFTLPRVEDIHLAIYDMLGREVAVLVDGTRPAGAQTITFDAAELPSGVYLYRLDAGGTVLTQRLTLVR